LRDPDINTQTNTVCNHGRTAPCAGRYYTSPAQPRRSQKQCFKSLVRDGDFIGQRSIGSHCPDQTTNPREAAPSPIIREGADFADTQKPLLGTKPLPHEFSQDGGFCLRDATIQTVLFPDLFNKPLVATFDQAHASLDGGAILLKAGKHATPTAWPTIRSTSSCSGASPSAATADAAAGLALRL
jgi:hypothetical protein